MIDGYGAVTQALLGTLLTWGLTAVGAGCVFFIRGKHRKLLDVSLGFAAGVMTAASYWSLLEPAISMCKRSKSYGSEGQYAFLPVAFGFLFGAVFVFGTDKFLDYLGINSAGMMMTITKSKDSKEKLEDLEMMTALNRRPSNNTSVVTMDPQQPGDFADCISNQHTAQRRRGHHHSHHSLKVGENGEGDRRDSVTRSMEARASQWKRIMLLVVAITVHNIPEGLAVGVSFAAAGSSAEASFHSARNLALGIGIQNFPEGLAVSLPLQAAGFSVWRAFWYGQLSGMVEPVFGVLGAVAVAAAQPALPYALAFAAGAMIYVVADDIIPEANASGNGKLATWGCIIGFVVMMCLDVGLGFFYEVVSRQGLKNEDDRICAACLDQIKAFRCPEKPVDDACGERHGCDRRLRSAQCDSTTLTHDWKSRRPVMRWMTISGGKKHCSAGARLSQHDVIAGGDAANGSVPPTTSHPMPAAYFTQSSDDKSIHILPLLLTVVLNIEFLQFQRN